MADRPPGKVRRRPAMSIEERRTVKRAKAIEAAPIVRKRKR